MPSSIAEESCGFEFLQAFLGGFLTAIEMKRRDVGSSGDAGFKKIAK